MNVHLGHRVLGVDIGLGGRCHHHLLLEWRLQSVLSLGEILLLFERRAWREDRSVLVDRVDREPFALALGGPAIPRPTVLVHKLLYVHVLQVDIRVRTERLEQQLERVSLRVCARTRGEGA